MTMVFCCLDGFLICVSKIFGIFVLVYFIVFIMLVKFFFLKIVFKMFIRFKGFLVEIIIGGYFRGEVVMERVGNL